MQVDYIHIYRWAFIPVTNFAKLQIRLSGLFKSISSIILTHFKAFSTANLDEKPDVRFLDHTTLNGYFRYQWNTEYSRALDKLLDKYSNSKKLDSHSHNCDESRFFM